MYKLEAIHYVLLGTCCTSELVVRDFQKLKPHWQINSLHENPVSQSQKLDPAKHKKSPIQKIKQPQKLVPQGMPHKRFFLYKDKFMID